MNEPPALDFLQVASRTIAWSPPQLLVSVRNATEMASAIRGGCDVVDVKDPARGSLGRADVAVWNAIDSELRRLNSQRPCSAALGEMIDDARSVRSQLPSGWQFAKLGTAGLHTVANWPHFIASAQQHWRELAPQTYQWILVVYADAEQANSPSLDELCEQFPEVLGTGDWDGVLIDTFAKNGRTLFDFVDASDLIALGDIIRASRKLWGIAGSLRADSLADVLLARPDIIGIRTAGCRDQRRDQSIEADAVRCFRDALHAAYEQTKLTTKAQS